MADEISANELAVLSSLDVLADHDVEFARAIAGLSWVVDGVTEEERGALGSLDGIAASGNVQFARAIAGLLWVTDGITEEELGALWSLNELVRVDLAFAQTVIGLGHVPSSGVRVRHPDVPV